MYVLQCKISKLHRVVWQMTKYNLYIYMEILIENLTRCITSKVFSNLCEIPVINFKQEIDFSDKNFEHDLRNWGITTT